jgi:hypothetical protein
MSKNSIKLNKDQEINTELSNDLINSTNILSNNSKLSKKQINLNKLIEFLINQSNYQNTKEIKINYLELQKLFNVSRNSIRRYITKLEQNSILSKKITYTKNGQKHINKNSLYVILNENIENDDTKSSTILEQAYISHFLKKRIMPKTALLIGSKNDENLDYLYEEIASLLNKISYGIFTKKTIFLEYKKLIILEENDDNLELPEKKILEGNFEKIFEEILIKQYIILIRCHNNIAYYTTIRNIELEKEYIKNIYKMQKSNNHSLVDISIDSNYFSKKLIEDILISPDIVCIQGIPGTGKTTLLSTLKEIYSSQNYTIFGASLSIKATQILSDTTKIQSYTLANWRTNWNKTFRSKIEKNSVFIIDEASMVDVDTLNFFLNVLSKKECKLILVGDVNQLPAIHGKGAFMKVVELCGAITLTEVRRQLDPTHCNATKLIANYDLKQALEIYEKTDVFRFSTKTIVNDYIIDYVPDYKKDFISKHVVTSYTNKDVNFLNKAIHKKLLEIGLLKNEVTIQLSKTKEIQLSIGDQIIFTENNYKFKFTNGQIGRVGNITYNNEENYAIIQVLQKFDDPTPIYVDTRTYPHIKLGYAHTAYKLQGSTYKTVKVVSNQYMKYEVFNTVMTRHTDKLNFYFDEKIPNDIYRKDFIACYGSALKYLEKLLLKQITTKSCNLFAIDLLQKNEHFDKIEEYIALRKKVYMYKYILSIDNLEYQNYLKSVEDYNNICEYITNNLLLYKEYLAFYNVSFSCLGAIEPKSRNELYSIISLDQSDLVNDLTKLTKLHNEQTINIKKLYRDLEYYEYKIFNLSAEKNNIMLNQIEYYFKNSPLINEESTLSISKIDNQLLETKNRIDSIRFNLRNIVNSFISKEILCYISKLISKNKQKHISMVEQKANNIDYTKIFHTYIRSINPTDAIINTNNGLQCGSLSFSTYTGLWQRFSTGESGNIYQFIMKAEDCTYMQALDHAKNISQNYTETTIVKRDNWTRIPITSDTIAPEKQCPWICNGILYKYYSIDHELIGYAVRIETKQWKEIFPLSYFTDGVKNLWCFKSFGHHIYGVEKLTSNKKPILIVEGEETTMKAQLQLPDYCVIGFGGTIKASKIDWSILKNYTNSVIIWPDNDGPGILAAKTISEKLDKIEIKSSIIYTHDLPQKWDLADLKDVTNTQITKSSDNNLSQLFFSRGEDANNLLKSIIKNNFSTKYQERLDKELSLIYSRNLSYDFLVATDIVRFCQRNNIKYNVRGSANASLVAFVLKIHNNDPIEYNLLFERFLDQENMPDFDIEVQKSKRTLVQQFLISKYKAQHLKVLNKLGKLIKHPCAFGILPSDDYIDLSLIDYTEIKHLGISKFDILSSIELDKYDNKSNDFTNKHVYDFIASGKTHDLFQLKNFSDLCINYKPQDFNDLVNLLAVIRPGSVDLSIVNISDPLGILASTRGNILFQEQIMLLGHSYFGILMTEINKFRINITDHNISEEQKQKYFNYASKHMSHEATINLYNAIISSAFYTYNKAHAVSYATLLYANVEYELNKMNNLTNDEEIIEINIDQVRERLNIT